MINPLDFTYNWTAIGSGLAALIAGHFHGKYNLSGKAWDGIKTFFTSESTKVKAEMETIRAKFETENTKKLMDLETRLKAVETKLNPPA